MSAEQLPTTDPTPTTRTTPAPPARSGGVVYVHLTVDRPVTVEFVTRTAIARDS